MTPVNSIVIAVSSCLLGHKVRYDGNDKRNSIVVNQLCNYFDCRPICPEYAIGLGVPRDPIQVVKIDLDLRALSLSDKWTDMTDTLIRYANFVCDGLPQLCGFILKARSPSCGLSDVPVYDERGDQISTGSGIFAGQVRRNKIFLPVIDEIQLAEPEAREKFIVEVKRYSHSIRSK